ncbi:helix-turn-helix domain-containing protein [Oxynema sp. CENA135]|uniref:helix-turn-helix domain-containing protein n=1 Tax=Oxynema sp. CENA135 TaxID=984206 RepID=UPI001F15F461|nr:helix-turn-helix domain-containing protein [Oxynema sp. CENA135]
MIVKCTYRIYPDRQPTQLLDEWLETLSASYSYALRELKNWIASRKYAIDRCSLESERILSAN